MRNIKIEIQYDGTQFSGWQAQPNARTVQEEIERAIAKLSKEEVKINGAGRTDAGVHAKGQVASFDFNSSVPTDRIPIALNTLLPKEISIIDAIDVPQDFHARYSAIGKKYSYLIYVNTYRDPLLRNYSYHVSYKLDINKMKDASRLLIGTHDFKGFMSTGGSVIDTVRRIDDISFNLCNKNLWISIEGNGFLYNMVRIIIGTLLEVGRGKINNEKILNALETGDRKQLGPTAPPEGLYLDKVFYPLTR